MRHNLGSGKTWVWMSALAWGGCVTLGKLLNLSVPQFLGVVPPSVVLGRVEFHHAYEKYRAAAA